MWFWGRCFWETFQTKIKKILRWGARGHASFTLLARISFFDFDSFFAWIKLYYIHIFINTSYPMLYTDMHPHIILGVEMKHVIWSQPAAGCKKLGGSNWQGIMTVSRCNCEKSRRRDVARNWGRKFWTSHIFPKVWGQGVFFMSFPLWLGIPFRQKDWSS